MSKPLFEERADRTLDKVRAVYAQRGGEYADTWRTCRFIAMKATAKKLGLVIHDDFFRALATAAFYDMKYERLSGGYKDDSVIDAIAYGSFWIDEMVDLDRPKQAKPEPEQQQYRMLEGGETIVDGDQYKSNSGHWILSGCAGTQVQKYEVGRYRRPIKPELEQQYRMLALGERIEKGDEFFSVNERQWAVAVAYGWEITEPEIGRYRRPINPQENAVR